MKIRTLLLAFLLLGVSSLASAATGSTIQRGIDLFATAGDGNSFYDFASNPIPAGFFCPRSAAFTGRIAFKGLPVATETPGQLWGADTIVERLDDTVLDAQGAGSTRIRLRALSLASVAPLETACGAFHVYVSLAGEQRVTTMGILRTEERGGSFLAPLAGDIRMTFIPVKPARLQSSRKLELLASFTFPANPLPWSFRPVLQGKRSGPVVVDTDGNLIPDSLLAGTSNFVAGQSPDMPRANLGPCTCCPWPADHIDPVTGHAHQTTLPMCPGTQNCC